jgi:thioredoxin 1
MNSYTTESNSENFQDKINQTEKAVVYIKASWCGPCKQLSPIIEEVSSEIGPVVTITKIDADNNMEFVKNLNVRNIPTLLFYKNGEIIERTVGMKSKNEILRLIESL